MSRLALQPSSAGKCKSKYSRLFRIANILLWFVNGLGYNGFGIGEGGDFQYKC
jgi:hypothetical protein